MTLALLASMTLTWNPNTETDIAGYKVYHGEVSGRYVEAVDVGNVTLVEVPGNILTPGKQIFFAVTAYNTSGLESDFSNEVSYTPLIVPPAAPVLTISVAGGVVTVSWASVQYVLYTVWYRDDDSQPWTAGSSLPGDGRPIHWYEIADRPKRMYRVEATR